MNREEYAEYFKTLKLMTDSSFEQMDAAYRDLKEAYARSLDQGGMEGAPDEEEIERIDAAYLKLFEMFREDGNICDFPEEEDLDLEASASEDHKPVDHDPAHLKTGDGMKDKPDKQADKQADSKKINLSSISMFTGPVLKDIREKMDVPLQAISSDTKVQARMFEYIEEEKYDMLPPGVYVKGFVTGYAKFLRLDHKKVASDYMVRFNKWKDERGRQRRSQKRRGFFS